MKKYSCLLFTELDVKKEIPFSYKELTTLSLMDAAIRYTDLFESASGIYYLVVTCRGEFNSIYEVILKKNYQGDTIKSIKPFKNISEELFNVLVNHTLSRG